MFKSLVPFVLSLAVAMPVDAGEFTWRGFNFTHGNAHKNDNAVYNSGNRRTGWGQDMPTGFVNTGDAKRVVARTTLAPNTIGATLDIYNRDAGDQGDVGVRATINGTEIFYEAYHMDKTTNGKRREIHIPEFSYEGKGKLEVVIQSAAREASSWWFTATPNCEARRAVPVMQEFKKHKETISTPPIPKTKADKPVRNNRDKAARNDKGKKDGKRNSNANRHSSRNDSARGNRGDHHRGDGHRSDRNNNGKRK
jgi:hypothetical protein